MLYYVSIKIYQVTACIFQTLATGMADTF